MSSSEAIKVMIVDDSVLTRKYLSQIINDLENMEVIATAPNGRIGIQKAYLYKPDIIILDIEMPELDGIGFLKHLQENSVPSVRPQILIFSSIVGDGSRATFEALEHGAADFIKKPEGKISENLDYVKKEFEFKINELYLNKRFPVKQVSREAVSKDDMSVIIEQDVYYGMEDLTTVLEKKSFSPELIAIVSSTGGPNAIRKIFDTLGDLPIPMVIAQHMPAGFTTEFAKNLSQIYSRPVIEAEKGQKLENGIIYICPGGCHSLIKKSKGNFYLETDYKEYEGFFFKPSSDLFFKSIYEAVDKQVLGVILSGMGKDGAIESVNLRKAGALIMAQDKNSSVVWGMPGNAVRSGGVDIILNINDLGNAINTVMSKVLR
jgi:two-component system chemotaxis response regulator CheB